MRETTLRLNLTRYLPGELAPVLSEAEFENLRQGQRIPVALLFVDIRDSSALGLTMEPGRLARFVTAFRRRVIARPAATGAWWTSSSATARCSCSACRRRARRRRPRARLRPHAPRPRRALEREAWLRPAGPGRRRHPRRRGVLRRGRRRGAAGVHRARRGGQRRGAAGAGDQDARRARSSPRGRWSSSPARATAGRRSPARCCRAPAPGRDHDAAQAAAADAARSPVSPARLRLVAHQQGRLRQREDEVSGMMPKTLKLTQKSVVCVRQTTSFRTASDEEEQPPAQRQLAPALSVSSNTLSSTTAAAACRSRGRRAARRRTACSRWSASA